MNSDPMADNWWIFFKLIAIICCCPGIMNTATVPSYGAVEPKDPFKFIGETLVLVCNINNTTVIDNSSGLYFRRNSSAGQSPIPEEYVNILNATAIQLELPNLKIEDEDTYDCMLENRDGDSRHIGQQIVKVDYKPQKVKAFACDVYNWMQMTCVWDLGVNFHHPENIEVSVTCSKCSNLTKTSCLVDESSFHYGHLYDFNVTVATTLNGNVLEASSQHFTVKTKHSSENSSGQILAINVPADVTNILAKVINSSCVELTWDRLKTVRDIYCVARYMSEWDQVWRKVAEKKNIGNILVCDLIPFTKYEFQVAVIPFPVNSSEQENHGKQSNWKTVSAQTLEDVPRAAPKICPTCYSALKCHQGPCYQIRLYWQDLTARDKHGIITQYKINSTNAKVQSKVWNSTGSQILTSVGFELPDHNTDYELSLTLGTRKGFSKVASSIYIPAYNKIQPPKDFVVESDWNEDGNLTFFLSWTVMPSQNYTGIVVLWCHKSPQFDSPCKGEIHWITLSADNKMYDLSLRAQGRDSEDFSIGIAAKSFDKDRTIASSIHWSSCIYLYNTKPEDSPKNVRFSSIHPPNGLTVIWDRFDCAKKGANIIKYQVRYCPTLNEKTCNGSEMIINVTSLYTEVTLTNLTQGATFLVYVSAVSSAGLGPESRAIKDVVKRIRSTQGKDLTQMYGAIFGTVALFTILVFLLICCLRYCKKRKDAIPEIESLVAYTRPQNDLNSERVFSNCHSHRSLEDHVTPHTKLISCNDPDSQNYSSDDSCQEAGHALYSRLKSFGNTVPPGQNELDKERKCFPFNQHSKSVDNFRDNREKKDKCVRPYSETDLYGEEVYKTISSFVEKGDTTVRKKSTERILSSDNTFKTSQHLNDGSSSCDEYICMDFKSDSKVNVPSIPNDPVTIDMSPAFPPKTELYVQHMCLDG